MKKLKKINREISKIENFIDYKEELQKKGAFK